MVDDRGEVGRTVELDRFKTLVVRLHDSIDAIAIWILRVSIL